MFDANSRWWRSWGGGSGRSDSKAHYAKLSLSSLLGYHSFSQLAFIAGVPKAGLYSCFHVLSPPLPPVIWFLLPLPTSSIPSKLLSQRSQMVSNLPSFLNHPPLYLCAACDCVDFPSLPSLPPTSTHTGLLRVSFCHSDDFFFMMVNFMCQFD